MYISEVIEQAKALHPSEYTAEEYLRWCDELSADIRRNYDIVYDKLAECSGEVMLPEGISLNDISKIVMDGRELKKTDLRDFGVEYAYDVRGRALKKTDGSVSDFEIIYAVPHMPTRYIDTDAEVTFSGNSFMCNDPVFSIGDIVKITDKGSTYRVSVTDMDEGVFFYIGDAVPEGTRTVHLFREIVEKTLIPAPYDSAYIDFVNAKVSLYQGDSAAHKTFIDQYNTKIKDYRSWLTRSMPRTKATFKSWL